MSKAADAPRPIHVGNVTIPWVKPSLHCLGGYPLPGGRWTQDPYIAAQAAASISELSRPVPPEPADVRARRLAALDGRWFDE
jgi:hypothetical protein